MSTFSNLAIQNISFSKIAETNLFQRRTRTKNPLNLYIFWTIDLKCATETINQLQASYMYWKKILLIFIGQTSNILEQVIILYILNNIVRKAAKTTRLWDTDYRKTYAYYIYLIVYACLFLLRVHCTAYIYTIQSSNQS